MTQLTASNAYAWSNPTVPKHPITYIELAGYQFVFINRQMIAFRWPYSSMIVRRYIDQPHLLNFIDGGDDTSCRLRLDEADFWSEVNRIMIHLEPADTTSPSLGEQTALIPRMTHLTQANTPSWSFDPHKLVQFVTLAEFEFCIAGPGILWFKHPETGLVKREGFSGNWSIPANIILPEAEFWSIIRRVSIGMLPPREKDSEHSPQLPASR